MVKLHYFIACKNGHLEIVQLLLKNGAAANITDNKGASPLTISSYYGYKEVVEILLNYKGDMK